MSRLVIAVTPKETSGEELADWDTLRLSEDIDPDDIYEITVTYEDAPVPLDIETFREQAHREWEIAKLMSPSDDNEQAWLDLLGDLVKRTDEYLAAAA